MYLSSFLIAVALSCVKNIKEYINIIYIGPQLPPVMDESRQKDFEALFGWAKRTNLAHPPIFPPLIEFMTWLFHRGNQKGKVKSSASLMVSHAEIYGTASRLFEGEEYWEKGITANRGSPIFLPEQIPEIWRVKGWIMGFATECTLMQIKKSSVKSVSPAEKFEQLVYYLNDSPNVKENKLENIKIIGDLNTLATNLIKCGIDFNEMNQTSISPHINIDGMNYNRDQKRAILHACSRVGKGIFLTMRDTIQENNLNPIPNPEIENDVKCI